MCDFKPITDANELKDRLQDRLNKLIPIFKYEMSQDFTDRSRHGLKSFTMSVTNFWEVRHIKGSSTIMNDLSKEFKVFLEKNNYDVEYVRWNCMTESFEVSLR